MFFGLKLICCFGGGLVGSEVTFFKYCNTFAGRAELLLTGNSVLFSAVLIFAD